MRKYLCNYINETEEKLKGNINQKDIDVLLNKINFFSHERLIHLIVTLFFSLFSIIITFLCFYKTSYLLIIISILLYIMDLFYILHYFYLENNVQYLYRLYDKMIKKLK